MRIDFCFNDPDRKNNKKQGKNMKESIYTVRQILSCMNNTQYELFFPIAGPWVQKPQAKLVKSLLDGRGVF